MFKTFMISAIVLAAGEAKRFGRIKQLVLSGEKTMLEHVLATVGRSRVDDIIVVLGAHSDEIRSRIAVERARVVVNAQWAQGMSSSLQAGIRALPPGADGALVVLADQPFITSATIDTLIDEFNRKGPGAAVPTFKGVRGNPVLLGRSLFDEVMRLRGDTGFRAVFGDHAESILKVAVDDPGILRDIDTMEDFDRAYAGHEANSSAVFDPVCGVTVMIEDARYTTEQKGRRYYFCGTSCQQRFERELERYIDHVPRDL